MEDVSTIILDYVDAKTILNVIRSKVMDGAWIRKMIGYVDARHETEQRTSSFDVDGNRIPFILPDIDRIMTFENFHQIDIDAESVFESDSYANMPLGIYKSICAACKFVLIETVCRYWTFIDPIGNMIKNFGDFVVTILRPTKNASECVIQITIQSRNSWMIYFDVNGGIYMLGSSNEEGEDTIVKSKMFSKSKIRKLDEKMDAWEPDSEP